jgi:MinD superfamily P-loop ATPase
MKIWKETKFGRYHDGGRYLTEYPILYCKKCKYMANHEVTIQLNDDDPRLEIISGHCEVCRSCISISRDDLYR